MPSRNERFGKNERFLTGTALTSQMFRPHFRGSLSSIVWSSLWIPLYLRGRHECAPSVRHGIRPVSAATQCGPSRTARCHARCASSHPKRHRGHARSRAGKWRHRSHGSECRSERASGHRSFHLGCRQRVRQTTRQILAWAQDERDCRLELLLHTMLSS